MNKEANVTQFSTEEINLICLYDPGNRKGTIYELRDMMRYLMPDETDLINLTQGVIAKLENLTDEEFDALVDDIDFSDEDSAYGLISPLWFEETDPDDEIE